MEGGRWRVVARAGGSPSPRLRLRPLRMEDEAPIKRAQQQLHDGVFLHGLSPDSWWPEVVERASRRARGDDLQDGWVPATYLVATVDGTLGRASIRHQLNEFLLRWGGHIGYAVLPQYRRRGLATEILRQSLIIARSLGVERTLLTCDEDNVASAIVIERCGGVLENVVDDPEGGPPKRRYWID